jgi:hypothetical protein
MTAVTPHVGRSTDIYLPTGGGVPVSALGPALTISCTLAPRPGSIVRCFAPTKCRCPKRRPLTDRSPRYCSNENKRESGRVTKYQDVASRTR